MKPLRYVFYCIWRFKQRNPREKTPLLVATLSVAVLLSFNILGVILIAENLVGARWLEHMGRTQRSWMGLIESAALFLVLHYSWVRSGRFLLIANEFEHEAAAVRRRNTIYVLAYVAATIAIPILAVILHSARA